MQVRAAPRLTCPAFSPGDAPRMPSTLMGGLWIVSGGCSSCPAHLFSLFFRHRQDSDPSVSSSEAETHKHKHKKKKKKKKKHARRSGDCGEMSLPSLPKPTSLETDDLKTSVMLESSLDARVKPSRIHGDGDAAGCKKTKSIESSSRDGSCPPTGHHNAGKKFGQNSQEVFLEGLDVLRQ